MSLDPGLVAICKKALEAKPRRFVTLPDVLAVALQESSGVATFTPWDPQYKLNMAAARAGTGMGEADIRKLIVIPALVETWKTPAIMVNKFAKFRFEKTYWESLTHLEMPERFYKSCSWGLGQLMGAHLPDTNAIRRFMGDVQEQGEYLAGMMDSLLVEAEGSLVGAYCGYNSGHVDVAFKIDVAQKLLATNANWQVRQSAKREIEYWTPVLDRAKAVAARAAEIKQELGRAS
jgi:hypothetical protein